MTDAASAIRNLLESGKYADLTIRCQEKMFRVHCAIVCTRSSVLAAAVDGKFKEAAMRDIDLPEDEVPIVTALIHYLYNGDYTAVDTSPSALLSIDRKLAEDCQEVDSSPAEAELVAEEEPAAEETPAAEEAPAAEEEPVAEDEPPPSMTSFELMFHVKTYVIADKYDVSALKILAKKKYESAIAKNCNWNTAAFSESAEHLWDNTMDSDHLLRDLVVATASEHLETLLDRGEFVEFMKSHGDFGVEILKSNTGWFSKVPPAVEQGTYDAWDFSISKKDRDKKSRKHRAY